MAWFLGALLVTGSVDAQSPDGTAVLLEHANEAWTGDLDGMVERGFVRVLTSYNPLFFPMMTSVNGVLPWRWPGPSKNGSTSPMDRKGARCTLS